jgi:hypothetical protein
LQSFELQVCQQMVLQRNRKAPIKQYQRNSSNTAIRKASLNNQQRMGRQRHVYLRKEKTWFWCGSIIAGSLWKPDGETITRLETFILLAL